MKFLVDILEDLNSYQGDNIYNDVPSFNWREEETTLVDGVLNGHPEYAVVDTADQGVVIFAYCSYDYLGEHGEPWRHVGQYDQFESEYASEIADYRSVL